MGINIAIIPICLMYCMVSVQCVHRPVIGILMQKAGNHTRHAEYVVFANYVKALEGAGAMVVPVRINEGISYYRTIMAKINGIVFPGGSANLQDPTDIGRAGMIIYRLAEELNNQGVHFPILGVCQGLQLLTEASAGMKPLLTPCSGVENIGLPLHFVRHPSETKLYQHAPDTIIKTLSTEPVTANLHEYCVTEQTLRKYHLKWRVMTVNRDASGLQFVSSMEHTRYPFVAVQFHPEKTIYDFAEGAKYRTDYEAVLANRWFYDWFVEESKKNRHHFSGNDVMYHIMERHSPTLVTNQMGTSAEYFFRAHWRNSLTKTGTH